MDGRDIVVSVSSERTCFWTVRIFVDAPPPPGVVQSCLAAFGEEYDDCEVTSVHSRLVEMPAFGRDVQFSCLDFLNTVALRSVRTTCFTLLVWWQGTDDEVAEYQNLLEQMTQSLRVMDLSD